MSCPTCDHTMQGIGEVPAVGGAPIFWCPRCGTLGSTDSGLGTLDYEAPKLVGRCQEFAVMMNLGPLSNSVAVDEWRRLGIAESINRPNDRGPR